MDSPAMEMRIQLEQAVSRLRMTRQQIDEIRALKETDPGTWWHEYIVLRDLECLGEQIVEKYKRRMWRAGIPRIEIDAMTVGCSAEERYAELMKKKER